MKDYSNLSVARFKRLMFESYLASTIISTYGKSPHIKIIQKIKQQVGSVSRLAGLFNLKFYRIIVSTFLHLKDSSHYLL